MTLEFEVLEASLDYTVRSCLQKERGREKVRQQKMVLCSSKVLKNVLYKYRFKKVGIQMHIESSSVNYSAFVVKIFYCCRILF